MGHCEDPTEESGIWLIGRTTDGGANWHVTAEVGEVDVSANPQIVFQDGARGWVSGDKAGNLRESKDGGSTWQRVADGIQPLLPFGPVDIGSDGTGWAAVPSGALIRRRLWQNYVILTDQGGLLAARWGADAGAGHLRGFVAS